VVKAKNVKKWKGAPTLGEVGVRKGGGKMAALGERENEQPGAGIVFVGKKSQRTQS